MLSSYENNCSLLKILKNIKFIKKMNCDLRRLLNMVNINFLARFKEITGEKTLEIDYTGDLSGLIDLLINKYGNNFKEALLGKNGEIKDYIKILVNGEDVNSLESDDIIRNDHEIVIFQAIAGG